MDCLHKVEALLILDLDGRTIYGKYFPDPANPSAPMAWPTRDVQLAYERTLHAKLRDPKAPPPSNQANADGDVMLYDGHTVLFKVDTDVTFIVVGKGDENELVLSSVLSCIYEAFQIVLKTVNPIDKRMLLENYDVLLLVIDETLDDGIILETAAAAVAQEVMPFVKPENTTAAGAKKAFKSISKMMKDNL